METLQRKSFVAVRFLSCLSSDLLQINHSNLQDFAENWVPSQQRVIGWAYWRDWGISSLTFCRTRRPWSYEHSEGQFHSLSQSWRGELGTLTSVLLPPFLSVIFVFIAGSLLCVSLHPCDCVRLVFCIDIHWICICNRFADTKICVCGLVSKKDLFEITFEFNPQISEVFFLV